jgi:SAM-dependent methyltransferase
MKERLNKIEIPASGTIWEKKGEDFEKKRRAFLRFVQDTYDPEHVYYPGSGTDRFPKEELGEDTITHLSLEENKDWYSGGYFDRLGSGQKVQGNYLQSPFKDGAFDAVFIHNTPVKTTTEGLKEFERVLKDKGVILLDNSNWDNKQLQDFLETVRERFQEEPLPPELNNLDNFLTHVSRRRPGADGGSVIGIATSEQELQGMLKNIPEEERCVTRQFFAVFKKKS